MCLKIVKRHRVKNNGTVLSRVTDFFRFETTLDADQYPPSSTFSAIPRRLAHHHGARTHNSPVKVSETAPARDVTATEPPFDPPVTPLLAKSEGLSGYLC